MGVHWFGMKISDQTVPLVYYFSIKECDKLPGPLGGKFDGCMVCVDIIYEFYQFFFIVCPDSKCVVYMYVSPPK